VPRIGDDVVRSLEHVEAGGAKPRRFVVAGGAGLLAADGIGAGLDLFGPGTGSTTEERDGAEDQQAHARELAEPNEVPQHPPGSTSFEPKPTIGVSNTPGWMNSYCRLHGVPE
jgi:hypothetical protein